MWRSWSTSLVLGTRACCNGGREFESHHPYKFKINNKLGVRHSWRGGTDCNNRVNCHKSLIGNWLEVSEYRTLLQSQSVAVRLSRFDSYLTHSL